MAEHAATRRDITLERRTSDFSEHAAARRATMRRVLETSDRDDAPSDATTEIIESRRASSDPPRSPGASARRFFSSPWVSGPRSESPDADHAGTYPRIEIFSEWTSHPRLRRSGVRAPETMLSRHASPTA